MLLAVLAAACLSAASPALQAEDDGVRPASWVAVEFGLDSLERKF